MSTCSNNVGPAGDITFLLVSWDLITKLSLIIICFISTLVRGVHARSGLHVIGFSGEKLIELTDWPRKIFIRLLLLFAILSSIFFNYLIWVGANKYTVIPFGGLFPRLLNHPDEKGGQWRNFILSNIHNILLIILKSLNKIFKCCSSTLYWK